MPKTRIYQDSELTLNDTVKLSDDAFGHIVRVLRLSEGDTVALFNGKEAVQYTAQLVDVKKKEASAKIIEQKVITNESPIDIHLGQGISRGDRMDYTLQKSVELGVSKITPLFTERCGVKLSGERLAKKHDQWQKIVISACEQSGRCIVPEVTEPMYLEDWLAQETNSLKLNLHPKATHSIMTLPVDSTENALQVRLLIGPEGGLSDEEISKANTADFQDILLGPRILRTETAALTAITALQCRFGDLA
ncbi:16S rRNA (uracil(1498)-N(3))-methyltransferase [Colwellia sp. 4_MG-2023]|jgi:16S rRNA (uracil1498-N3)-methyltransferase|uniref:16S rRNA (uracil(1498)-N(3))-methyltransferase n=1 Tax=unclassified Colwellia TaxID=196834 RepID=UPI001C07F464|nr:MULTISPECIES: 16S rRNA (uracil(1498)-N(3))-methyltransferase [unclassified Colwellia]MBU2923118.1 16S rRNA (uracil(1498)-N(3))-methyltransferase [Colwellia sp. C2M11]MDO6508262.1 16S rRNA (uracil(1498)-N(3))-methyltransferase [Colwellia sp. 5_MG-2023]MDO6556879.1 16S rRNA (uracil(1498)-N(3))-methyltransferase [Colwellia sp. 4_MG-2023]MDO6651453.1 16S rRNA (uracil(1498)-N(3))-methyltransferase [Colwellia sp. 3_MG-2023]MDO6664124.1 16S rRNA (uracil(1498)-N(3))-methyltransferase [Colwellia sp.